MPLETPRSTPAPHFPLPSPCSSSPRRNHGAPETLAGAVVPRRGDTTPTASPPCPSSPASTTSSFPQINRARAPRNPTPASPRTRRSRSTPSPNSPSTEALRPRHHVHCNRGELLLLLI